MLNLYLLKPCLSPMRYIAAAALLVQFALGFTGCNASLDQKIETLKDLRPFVPRSDASRQAKVDADRNIEDLIARLNSQDTGVVIKAMVALGQTGEKKAVQPLIKMLGHEDASVRQVSMQALIQLKAVAVPDLIDALTRKNHRIVVGAMETLAKIGDKRSIEPLINILKTHRSEPIREAAMAAVGKMGGLEIIPPLLEILKDKNSPLQYAAAAELARIGEPAVLPLSDMLKNPDEDIVVAATDILGKIGDERAARPIADLLKPHAPDAVKMSAVKALGKIGNSLAVPVLIKMMADPLSVVRTLASKALTRLGPESIEPLIDALKSKDPEILDLASEALVGIGLAVVAPLSRQLIPGHNSEFLWSAMDTLGAIRDKSAVAPVTAMLKSPDPDLRLKAVETLGVIGSAMAIPQLIAEIKHPDSSVKFAAKEALMAIGPAAIDPLIAALHDSDSQARELISAILAGFGPAAANPLASAMLTMDKSFRDNVAAILTAIGGPSVIPLFGVLKDKNPGVQASATQALTVIGDQEAVKALIRGMQIWHCRKTAAAALDRLGWRPEKPNQHILNLVAKGRKMELIREWDLTRYVLLSLLRSSQKTVSRYGLYALIAIGDTRILTDLDAFFKENADHDTARIYLGSGEKNLVSKARLWISQHENPAGEDQRLSLVKWGSLD